MFLLARRGVKRSEDGDERLSARLAGTKAGPPSPGTLVTPSSQEVEAGGSGVQGHLRLHSEREASLDLMRPCL